MGERYYIDTAIWIDFHENRKDRFRPLGEWAFEMFKKIVREKGEIIYTNLLIVELSGKFSMEVINKILQAAGGRERLTYIKISNEEAKEASILSKELKIPRGDCLHAIVARDNGAIMVTRDWHFEQLRHIVEVKKPEELL